MPRAPRSPTALPNLNFGRLNDPVINDLLDQARETEDPDERRALAQDINRQFAERVLDPAALLHDVGHHHEPVGPEHRPRPAARTATATPPTAPGFPGQVWLDSVYKTD